MSARLTRIGTAERLRVRLLMREMRRYIRTHGTLPKLDSDEPGLQLAWIRLGQHMARNAKPYVSAQRQRRAQEWGAP